MGIEAQSFGFNVAQIGEDYFLGLRTATLTPYFLFCIQWSRNFFVEPGIGITMNKWTMDYTQDDTHSLTDEISFRELNFGIACLYVTNPDDFTSPFFRFGANLHLLDGRTSEQFWNYMDDSIETLEEEISSTAISFAGGLGGMLTVKDRILLTVEGRLLYAYMGDVKRDLSGPGTQFFEDNADTRNWTLDTNMVVGFRILM
jgi:hypothetical protein